MFGLRRDLGGGDRSRSSQVWAPGRGQRSGDREKATDAQKAGGIKLKIQNIMIVLMRPVSFEILGLRAFRENGCHVVLQAWGVQKILHCESDYRSNFSLSLFIIPFQVSAVSSNAAKTMEDVSNRRHRK